MKHHHRLIAVAFAVVMLTQFHGPLASLDPTTADEVADEIELQADDMEAVYPALLDGTSPPDPETAQDSRDDMHQLRKTADSIRNARPPNPPDR